MIGEVKRLNKKVLMCAVSFLAVGMFLSIGTAFAEKPVDVEMVMFLNAEIVSAIPVGNNIISEREIVGSFTSGPVEGDVTREIRVVIHDNGKITVQNTIYVENAVLTLDGVVAEGSFVMKAMGMVGNVKWTIISSDLTVEGESVKLHGQGTATVTAFIPVDTLHYNLENTLTGQLHLTP